MEHLKIVLIGIGIAVGIVAWAIFGLWLINKIVDKVNAKSYARLTKQLEEESNKKEGEK